MKYLKQFTIIALVSFLGEILAYYISLTIPGSVYGLILMFIFLCTGVLKSEDVKETSSFLLSIMSVTFIPSAVGIITLYGEIRSMMIPLLVIIVLTTVLTFAVSGKVSDLLIGRKKDE